MCLFRYLKVQQTRTYLSSQLQEGTSLQESRLGACVSLPVGHILRLTTPPTAARDTVIAAFCAKFETSMTRGDRLTHRLHTEILTVTAFRGGGGFTALG